MKLRITAAFLCLSCLLAFAQTTTHPYKVGWYSDVTSPDKLAGYANSGATVMLANAAAWYITQPSVIQIYLDQAASLGMKVVISMTLSQCTPYNMSSADFLNTISTFKSHPALAGWYIADEPESCSAAYGYLANSPAYYPLLKSADTHPGLIVQGGSATSAYVSVEDTLGVDYYPGARTTVFGGLVPGSYDAWRNGLNFANANGKAFIAVAEGFGTNPHATVYNDMTYAEERYHVFSAVVQGVPQILFWYDAWADSYMINLVGQMMTQIQSIGAEMNSGTTNDPRITVGQPASNLTYRYGLNGSSQVILAVNIANRSGGGATLSNVPFVLPAGVTTSQVTVLAENRTLPVVNGTFADSFSPFDVHIYQFVAGTSGTSSGDTTPPSVPTNLSVTAAYTSEIDLSWSASTDNVGVAGYQIYRNGAALTKVPGTAYQDTGLAAATKYSYTVAAYDEAGNISSQSTAASATTLSAPDTTPPSVPANLSATAVSTSEIDLSWTASTDNVGVAGYQVYRNGVLLTNVPSALYKDTGLTASTPYSYTVAAFDAAGNVSAQSGSATAITLSPPAAGNLAVTITSPLSTSTVPRGSTVALKSLATDNLTVTGMSWVVDGNSIPGVFTPSATGGSNAARWNAGNGRGWHTITASATDSGGKTVSTSIRVRAQ